MEKECVGENVEWKPFTDLEKIIEKCPNEYPVEQPKIENKEEN